jgi:hypothetical protein
VTCSFSANKDPTTTGTTLIQISLPIACSVTPISGYGSAACGSLNQSGTIKPSNSSSMQYDFIAADGTNRNHSGTFQYVVN